MKAKKVLIVSESGPESIKIVEYDVEDPGENEIRIRVKYSGLAYADYMIRKVSMPGLPGLPFTPGADVSGYVDKIGSNVKGFREGDRVCALLMAKFGGQSQYVIADKDVVYKIPDDIPMDRAVCFLVNYLTAYQMLNMNGLLVHGEVKDILVHGGSGGVGSALIQLLLVYDHRVFSTASNHNLDMVNNLGAIGIDYRNHDFAEILKRNMIQADYVFDPVGGDYTGRSLKILKKGGTYIAYGFQKHIAGGIFGIIRSLAGFYVLKLMNRHKHLKIFQLNKQTKYGYDHDLDRIFELYREKKIDPVISEIVDIDDAARAHIHLEKGIRQGKILIKAG